MYLLYIGKNKPEVLVIAGSRELGDRDGLADECAFNYIKGLAIDVNSCTCYVADNWNHKIRRIIKFS